MKTLPKPFEFVEISDGIELDKVVGAIAGYLNVTFDTRTKAFGDRLTAVLVETHKLNLPQDENWNENFQFISKAVIECARHAKIHPGILEAIRRGQYPYDMIDFRLQGEIVLFIQTQRFINFFTIYKREEITTAKSH